MPTGNVERKLIAILSADVQGYCRLMGEDELGTLRALTARRELANELVLQHRGRIVDTAGDGFLAEFASAVDAVQSALDIQRALENRNAELPAERHMVFRIGINVGDVIVDGARIYGEGVNIAARLQAMADGGGICISGTVFDQVETKLAFRHESLGERSVKNIRKPVRVYRLDLQPQQADVAPTCDAAHRPVPASPVDAATGLRHGPPFGPRPDLPAAPAALLGREHEVEALRDLLGKHRLVTIVGAGGIGKTVLALAAAHLHRAGMADGASWVELARIADPSLLPATLAQALGLPIGDGVNPWPSLLAALKPLTTLVVLDNAEHIIDAVAPLVSAVVGTAAGIRLLVTSQAPLRVDGEHVFRLGALEVPPPDTSPADAARAGAIALFVDRARAVDHRFELTTENVPTVIRLCRRLDGLPLAIRLAVARLPLLGLLGLEARLDERLQLLAGESRDAPPRQQTLLAALDWSHSLLPPEDQALFRKLGVFVGGFTIDLAVAVCSDAFVDEWAVIDGLGRLVERSLVGVDAGDPPRYRLLEIVRDYALRRLGRCGGVHAASHHHARAIAAAMHAAAEALWKMPDAAWLAQWTPELDNVRAALDWSQKNDPALWVALVGAAPGLFRLLDLDYELRSRAAALDIGSAPGIDPERAAAYWVARATLQAGVGTGPGLSHDFALKAERLARTLADPRWLYLALCRRAASWLVSTDESAALRSEIARLASDDWPARLRAERWFAEFTMHSVNSNWPQALQAAENGLKEAAEAGAMRLTGVFANGVLVALLGLHKIDQALTRSREMRTWPWFGRGSMAIPFLGTCARCLLLTGDLAGAKHQIAQMFDLCRTVEWNYFAFFGELYVRLALADERFEAAAHLLGYATAARERAWGKFRPMHFSDEASVLLASAMDPATLARLRAEGEQLDEEAVCTLVLGIKNAGWGARES